MTRRTRSRSRQDVGVLAQRIDAGKRSARARWDAALETEVQRVFAENFGVSSAQKICGCGGKASRWPAALSSG